jgi:Flp pilus assembly secretin CpaC
MAAVLRACALGLAFLLTAISATWAADQTITLRLGAGSPLALERAFKTVLIGDPRIVDVQTRSDRSVVLEPLSLGATNLVFIDGESIAIVNVRILVCNAIAIRISYPDRAGCQ